jgi:peptidyl-tRNA hydrolase, PTH2 family
MDNLPSGVVLSTSIVTFISGFMLGVYSIRGYLISPDLAAERRANIGDPVESDESDVDEGDTILDHAPNWANGVEADRRDGLRQRQTQQSGGEEKKKSQKKKKKDDSFPSAQVADPGDEECKLVLVVRTDLGMTKGTLLLCGGGREDTIRLGKHPPP